MSDTVLSLETCISQVPFRGRELRIIRPRQLAPGITLRHLHNVLHAQADRTGLEQLAACWCLAAFSTRSIVFVPLRRNAGHGQGRRLDLVLVHSALQFPLAQWKALRSRLGAGARHTVKPGPPGEPPDPRTDPERWKPRQSRNLIVFDCAAETLFVVGNRDGFRLSAGPISRLLSDPAAGYDTHAGHCCVTHCGGRRRSGTGRHATPGLLHIQYNTAV